MCFFALYRQHAAGAYQIHTVYIDYIEMKNKIHFNLCLESLL